MQIFINYTIFWKQKIVHFEVFYEKKQNNYLPFRKDEV